MKISYMKRSFTLILKDKDENISFDECIDNLVLWIYWKILVNILTQNIDTIKIYQNLWKYWKLPKNNIRSNNTHILYYNIWMIQFVTFYSSWYLKIHLILKW